MELKNNRGEVVTITLVAVAIVVGLLGLFAAPTIGKVLPIFSNNQKIVSTKTVESKPVWIKNPDGSSTMVQTTVTNEDLSNEPMKLTFMQKVRNLGGLGILLVILGCIFPPFGAILMFVWKKISSAAQAAINSAHAKIDEMQTLHDELSGDAKLIVKSIDEGLTEFDMAINVAQASVVSAQAQIASCASIADTTTRTASLSVAQANLNTAQAVQIAVTNLKKAFLVAMSRKQDSTTKLLVAELKND